MYFFACGGDRSRIFYVFLYLWDLSWFRYLRDNKWVKWVWLQSKYIKCIKIFVVFLVSFKTFTTFFYIKEVNFWVFELLVYFIFNCNVSKDAFLKTTICSIVFGLFTSNIIIQCEKFFFAIFVKRLLNIWLHFYAFQCIKQLITMFFLSLIRLSISFLSFYLRCLGKVFFWAKVFFAGGGWRKTNRKSY